MCAEKSSLPEEKKKQERRLKIRMASRKCKARKKTQEQWETEEINKLKIKLEELVSKLNCINVSFSPCAFIAKSYGDEFANKRRLPRAKRPIKGDDERKRRKSQQDREANKRLTQRKKVDAENRKNGIIHLQNEIERASLCLRENIQVNSDDSIFEYDTPPSSNLELDWSITMDSFTLFDDLVNSITYIDIY